MFNTNDLRKKLHVLWNRHCLTVFTLVAVVGTSYAAINHADALYILTSVEDSAIVLDDETDTADLSSQLVFLSSNSTGYDVTLTAGQRAQITYNGTVLTTETRKETVSALLKRLEIQPSPLEMVAVNFSEDGVELTVASELTYYDRVTETEPYETIRRTNPYLAKGTEKVVQAGVDGTRTSMYEVVWSGGEQVSRQFVEELDGTAVDEIVEVRHCSVQRLRHRPHFQRREKRGRQRYSCLPVRRYPAVLRCQVHDRHRLHRRIRRRGHLHRHRHRRRRGHRGRGQERHPSGHPDVYRHQRRFRRLRHGRCFGHRCPRQQGGPLLRHLSAVHQFWTAQLHRLHPPLKQETTPGSPSGTAGGRFYRVSSSAGSSSSAQIR